MSETTRAVRTALRIITRPAHPPVARERRLENRDRCLTQYNPGYTMAVMKTAVSLPDFLYRAANRLARRLGISRSEVFQRALGAYVSAHEDAGVTEALDAIYPEGGEAGRLDQVFERLQAASLPREDW